MFFVSDDGFRGMKTSHVIMSEVKLMIKTIEGLTSEKEFLEVLEHKINICSNEITLVKLDIDDFETVNRFYGEFIGDQTIRKVAHVLVNNLEEKHLVCRTYKDEFTVLMNGTTTSTGTLMIEEIRTYFDEHVMLIGDPPKEISIRFSAGVASFPQNGKSASELLDAVDRAVKSAKSKGKNQVQVAQNGLWVKKQVMIECHESQHLHELSRELDRTEAGLFREALRDLFEKYRKESK